MNAAPRAGKRRLMNHCGRGFGVRGGQKEGDGAGLFMQRSAGDLGVVGVGVEPELPDEFSIDP